MRSRTPAQRSPTLLVFTLGAAAEQRRRRLLPAAWSAEERALHGACFEHAVAVGRASGCRVAVSTPTTTGVPRDVEHLAQPGRTFGERLARAADACQVPDRPLMVVGTDAPDLETRHVTAAIAHLRADPGCVVLGPARDGGVYLIASSAPLGPVLAGTRWRRRDTGSALARRFRAAGHRVVFLETLGDLDRRVDLDAWLATRASALWRGLVDRIRTLLAAAARPEVIWIAGRPRCLARVPHQGRGPPAR